MKARVWADRASKELLAQKVRPIKGPVEVDIELCSPTKRSFDLDNRIKAVLDLLVKCYIIEADNHSIVRRITALVGEGFEGARITIRKVNDVQKQNPPECRE